MAANKKGVNMDLRQLIEKIEKDEKLKQSFIKDPKKLLSEEGIILNQISLEENVKTNESNVSAYGCHKVGHSDFGCVTVG